MKEQSNLTLVEKVDEISDKMKEIHLAVVGNESIGVKGLVSTVKNQGDRISIIEENTKKFKWMGLGSLFSGALIGGALGSSTLKSIAVKIATLFLVYLTIIIIF